MTTEENKHNEEIIRATQLWECGDITREQLEYIFPQLAESEDEKNVKDLIDELKCSLRAANCQNDACGGGHEKRIALLKWSIAWIEKQQDKEYTFKSIPRLLEMIEQTDKAKSYCKKLIDSLQTEGYVTDAKIVSDCLKQMNGEKVAMATMDEQNPVDKVEPKFNFRVGQWIVATGKCVYLISKIDGFNVTLIDVNSNEYLFDISSLDDAHLWSIADAKPGDVLACCDNKPFIFKGFFGLNFPNCLAAYCGVTLENQFRHCNGKTFWTNQDVKPATKEQCNLLFQKMHEAGYTWDAENKELKKLEKQYNPKFKVGDWITNGNSTLHITNMDYGFYQFEDSYDAISIIDEKYRLWSIQDAKSGDVLADKYGNIGIYQGDKNAVTWNSCCYCGVNKGFYDGGTHEFPCYPATKEQRDKLFKAMADKGYEWNAENKELKKIESNPDKLIEESYQQQADDLIDMVTEKCYWNEEDEKMVNDIIASIDTLYYHGMVKWLKSIKYRIQPQPKQDGKWKWEEDDEKFFKENILIELGNIDGVSPELYSKIIDWISLIKKRLS